MIELANEGRPFLLLHQLRIEQGMQVAVAALDKEHIGKQQGREGAAAEQHHQA